MSILGKLFGGSNSNSFENDNEVDIFGVSETCPHCGDEMHGDGIRFECPNCGVLFLENGDYVSPWNRTHRRSGTCSNCEQSLSGGNLILPWEDGDNSYAYVTCPCCGHKNIKYGFGEDD